MNTTTAHARPNADTEPIHTRMFGADIRDQVLRSVRQLGKPTAQQLHRLHRDVVTDREMRGLLNALSSRTKQFLTCIKPKDIDNLFLKLPYIYIDTTKSRRHLEQHYAIPFRRIPEKPSCDIRFLRHDIGLVDELISFELTARARSLLFLYESLYEPDDTYILPKLQIEHGGLLHKVRPQPDKIVFINGYRIIIEHDCGEETIRTGNIIRDATVGRKYLVYDQLWRAPTFDQLRWPKVIYLYIIEGQKRTKQSSEKRMRKCLDEIPPHIDAKKVFFVNRHAFLEAGDDVSELNMVRGDGKVVPLPCFKKLVS